MLKSKNTNTTEIKENKSKINVTGTVFSETAKQKIEKAGGTASEQ